MTFFKIPVTELVTKLKDPSHPLRNIEFNVSQLGMYDGLQEHRFWVHISARRTGKSFAASALALAKLLEPNKLVTVVAPNYNLSSIIWDFVTGFITTLGLETKKWNAKDKVIVLCNDSVFRLLSVSNRDSLIGRGADLLIIDEAAVIDGEEYFIRDLRPALSTFPDSRALFITTPRGKANYMYKYYLRGPDPDYEAWGSGLYTWEANPYLTTKDVEEARKSSETTKSEFLQEYYCEWTTHVGQIYAISESKHLQDLSHIEQKDSRFAFIAGLDIGYRDATAFVVIATDGTSYWVVDEYITRETTTDVFAEEIKQRVDDWDIENIYIDHSAAQARADLAYNYDVYCDNAIKSVNDGISHVQVLVENDKLIFDENNAYATFQAMSAYRWNPRTETQKPVHDDSSHASDAVRYAIYSHHRNTVGIYVLD